MSSNQYANLECCENNECVLEDESFTPLSFEEAIQIRSHFNDPILDQNIKFIYECHGDPSGNMIYVGGESEDHTYCIYIKYKDSPNTTKILRCNTLIDYVQQLAELDQQLFNS
jgi:hypothetical protein